ncbi:MAG: DUF6285 domain-containing protein [Alphaproteobacteria bacterium]|nr:DUF6285 domain-containing protein [Rhodobiaceae bacterium]|tara:strand:- start:633 stop:1004 length:372 start_codon:yes stop_codon:yes gene_type:complete
MNNPPSKEELITSIIEFIENDIIDELIGQKRFHAHVAKNSLQIVLRQLKVEEKNNQSEKSRLKEILKIDKDLNEMNKILCQKIDNEEIDINNNDLIDHLFKTTMEKLSIDQPNYSAYLDEKTN